ncbi:MAG: GerMN domain-containing protein [Candidatus Eisenbacteria bacterium]
MIGHESGTVGSQAAGSERGADVSRRLRQTRLIRGRPSRRPPWAAVLIVLSAMALLAVIWVLRTQVPKDFPSAPSGMQGHTLPPQRACELYFGDAGLTGLEHEVRFFPITGVVETEARAVIAALIGGSLQGHLSPWPPETIIRDVFLTSAGVLYVNFDASLRWLSPAGDGIEWLLVASLTRTLCANFPALRAVRIQIDGESAGVLIRQIPLEWTFTPEMFEELR